MCDQLGLRQPLAARVSSGDVLPKRGMFFIPSNEVLPAGGAGRGGVRRDRWGANATPPSRLSMSLRGAGRGGAGLLHGTASAGRVSPKHQFSLSLWDFREERDNFIFPFPHKANALFVE